MNSAGFNIGLTNGEKNSSRVLKPPGGGHSDIFGIKDQHQCLPTPTKRRIQQQTSQICFGMPETVVTADENTAPKEVVVVVEKNGEENQNIAKPEPRSRVPPGGFSSGGFW